MTKIITTIYLDMEIRERAQNLCRSHNIPLSKLIERLLTIHLKTRKLSSSKKARVKK